MTLLEHWPDLLTIQEAAEILRTDPTQVALLVKGKEILHTEIAGKALIPRQYLENFIAESCKVCYDADIAIPLPSNDQEGQHLDNCKELDCMPFQEGENEMAKITRTVTLNGVKHWIRANTEQEYAEKLLKLVGSQNTAQQNSKHLFADYAMTWFETYSKPNIETVTATTYKRQLTRHLLPAFEGLTVEELTTDDVQRLFNGMTGSKATTPYSVEQMRFLVQHIGDIKTQSSTRTIGLSALAVPYLLQVKAGEFVFGGKSPLSYTQVRRMCDRIKRDIGFDENITPIRFRTTVLTDLYDQTKDIKLAQAAAEHTTSAMTLRYYVKGRETISKAAAVVDQAYSR